MSIYIDPPFWPAHGTLFSHLISNASTAELHAFAAAAGIPERAFDRDHYDVPERRYAGLVSAGALPVSGKELVRILVASGLRVRARHRNSSVRAALQYRWDTLMADARTPRNQTPGGPTARAQTPAAALGADLLDRWHEPHRHYHGATHLLAMLEALDLLGAAPDGPFPATTEPATVPSVSADPANPLTEAVPRTVLLAAWFHDAVYEGLAGEDEEASAALAEASLKGIVPDSEVAEVARLVRLTATHAPDDEDHDGARLCDADLSVLGGSPGQYARYLAAVREDYAHVGDDDFARGRAAVVRQLLALEPLFHTATARRLWLEAARENLRGELAEPI